MAHALANNSVTVNSGAADRKGEYFHREISIANGSGASWISTEAKKSSAVMTAPQALPWKSGVTARMT